MGLPSLFEMMTAGQVQEEKEAKPSISKRTIKMRTEALHRYSEAMHGKGDMMLYEIAELTKDTRQSTNGYLSKMLLTKGLVSCEVVGVSTQKKPTRVWRWIGEPAHKVNT